MNNQTKYYALNPKDLNKGLLYRVDGDSVYYIIPKWAKGGPNRAEYMNWAPTKFTPAQVQEDLKEVPEEAVFLHFLN